MEEVRIIYEDADIIAVDKPAGLLMHPVPKIISKSKFLISKQIFNTKIQKPKTLVDWLVKNYPEIKGVGDEPKLRPGIVHRLDKNTSGVLLVAKTQEAFLYLKGLFQKREVKKKYLVLLVGKLKRKEGIIDRPIARAKKDPTKRVAVGKIKGVEREAKTEYKVLRYLKDSDGNEYTLCEARPLTGRTHQIRSHFTAINYPVVCDRVYAGKKYICPAGLKRHFLHAKSLEFVSPSGARLLLEAELAEDLQALLDNLKKED